MPRKKPFRFLDLPPELRNRIYTLVFEGTATWILRGRRQTQPKKKEHLYSKAVTHPAGHNKQVAQRKAQRGYGLPGLLLANRQVREEAVLLFHAITQFIVTSHISDQVWLTWLKELDPKLTAAIRLFRYRVLVPCPARSSFVHLDSDYQRFIDSKKKLFSGKLEKLGTGSLNLASSREVEVWTTGISRKLWPRND